MRLLVIDSDGMIGHVVTLYLKEQGHDVTGYSEMNSMISNCVQGELYDTESIGKVIREGAYDAVINCSAIINQWAENDKEKATWVNAYLPHFLAKITKDTGTVIVHRSTDCVFSGRRGKYEIGDIPDAESFYAKTKVLGEIVNGKDITIRTSLIGPERDLEGTSLFNWFMQQEGQVKGFANALWTGLTTLEYAKVIEQLLQQKAHGLFHCVPKEAISKYDLLCLFEKYFPKGRKILKIENERVDKSLVYNCGSFDISIANYETMIKDMVHWIKTHKEIYTNY